MLPVMMVSDIPINCINSIANEYHLPAKLLISVLNVEQGKTGLKKRNKDGSYDLGEMQINSRWWPMLYKYHITPHEVLYQPCINLRVAAWILATNIVRSHNLLEGVGNYHSHTPVYNHAYAQKVREKYTALQFGTRLVAEREA